MKKQRFAQIDLQTGNILAFDLQNPKLSNKLLETNFLSISEEAYNLILVNQGQIIVDIAALSRYIQNNQAKIKDVLITEELLVVKHSIRQTKLAKKEKNNRYKDLYINYGVKYNNVVYPFTLEDRIRYTEQALTKDDKYINSENGIVKVSKTDFNNIYKAQLKNQRYWEVYTEQYNLYIDTLKTYEEITNLGYEITLPNEYQEVINKEFNTEEDTFEVLLNELQHLDDNDPESVFKRLQDLEFTIEEIYFPKQDDTTVTETISDIKNIINDRNKELVQTADRKYRKHIEQQPEFWNEELEQRLNRIIKKKRIETVINKPIQTISDNSSLTNTEKQALSNLPLTAVEGVENKQVEEFNNNKPTADVLRVKAPEPLPRDEELDKVLETADTITNNDIQDLIEEVVKNE